MQEGQSEASTHVVHFSVSGEFITGHARDLVQEGNWRGAYDFLMDTLHGIDAQAALDIVQGTKKLTGVNDLELEDDDCQAEVEGWLNWQFLHCIAFAGKVFRPYGYVTSLRRDDWHLAREIAVGDDLPMLRNKLWPKADKALSEPCALRSADLWADVDAKRLRSAYYAHDRASDVVAHVNLTPVEYRPVLFELVDADVPLWHKLPTDACSVARKAYAEGRLVDLSAERFPVPEGKAAQAVAEMDSELDAVLDEPRPVDEVAEQVRREARLRQLADDEARAEAEDAAAMRTEDILRAQVRHFADSDAEYGWLQLKGYDEQAGRNVELRVPHRAFVCAALGRARAWHLMPEYESRSPSGMKLPNDDRCHTDAWLGSGLELDAAYDHDLPEQRLFMKELYELQRKWLSFSFDLLARGKEDFVAGTVTHDPAQASLEHVLVLKTAAPEFAPAARKCKAVIVETGSKLAHLVVVSREDSVPVLRMAGALERFPEGRRVYISLDSGTVELAGT